MINNPKSIKGGRYDPALANKAGIQNLETANIKEPNKTLFGDINVDMIYTYWLNEIKNDYTFKMPVQCRQFIVHNVTGQAIGVSTRFVPTATARDMTIPANKMFISPPLIIDTLNVYVAGAGVALQFSVVPFIVVLTKAIYQPAVYAFV